MNRTRNTLYVALLSALFLFAGMLTLRAAAAQQSGDQTDSSATKKPSESKQTSAATSDTAAATGAAAKPVPANTPASAPATKPAPASTPAASKPAAKQQTRPANSAGMVWVNTDSGIYHKPGTRYYGKTKQGKYMSEADAIKAGYRAAGKN
jgi:hypothetical protein